mmetsp:Transcript_6431/g.6981  ORF Transcript_6431/g.6981 Transcript_6431/m.6981 type:complete len:310 (-) Transcript_6431:20-949(-)
MLPQYSPTKGDSPSPTKLAPRHIAHARRKLLQYFASDVEEIEQETIKRTKRRRPITMPTNIHIEPLPTELWSHIFSYLQANDLLAVTVSSKHLLALTTRHNQLWTPHINDIYNAFIPVPKKPCLSTFLLLRQYLSRTSPITRTFEMLQSNTYRNDREVADALATISNFFESKGIDPWKTEPGVDRLRRELRNEKYNHLSDKDFSVVILPLSKGNTCQTTLYFYVVCKSGFYQNYSSIKFSLKVDASYPRSPPVVECITNIYHPSIENGMVALHDIIEWRSVSTCGISQVISAVKNILLTPTYLTGMFDL